MRGGIQNARAVPSLASTSRPHASTSKEPTCMLCQQHDVYQVTETSGFELRAVGVAKSINGHHSSVPPGRLYVSFLFVCFGRFHLNWEKKIGS